MLYPLRHCPSLLLQILTYSLGSSYIQMCLSFIQNTGVQGGVCWRDGSSATSMYCFWSVWAPAPRRRLKSSDNSSSRGSDASDLGGDLQSWAYPHTDTQAERQTDTYSKITATKRIKDERSPQYPGSLIFTCLVGGPAVV